MEVWMSVVRAVWEKAGIFRAQTCLLNTFSDVWCSFPRTHRYFLISKLREWIHVRPVSWKRYCDPLIRFFPLCIQLASSGAGAIWRLITDWIIKIKEKQIVFLGHHDGSSHTTELTNNKRLSRRRKGSVAMVIWAPETERWVCLLNL